MLNIQEGFRIGRLLIMNCLKQKGGRKMVGYFDNEVVCGWYYFEDSYYGDGTKETAEMIAIEKRDEVG